MTPLDALLHRIESASALDSVAKLAAGNARTVISGPLKDLASGTWLGHAVHPMLTDLVIGSFTSATLLDLLAGADAEPASEALIGVGIAAYLPTAFTGVSDWADTEPVSDEVRRAGLVHAGTNALALGLYSASLAARRQGARGRGVALGVAGAGVLAVGGYIGGHLSLRRGVGPNQTVFDPGPSDWTRAAEASALEEGVPQRVVVQDTPVLLLRREGVLFAIHDRCSHRGCSLSDGSVEGREIVCGCHGSRFDLRDGSVLGGPATAPQPAYSIREQDGAIEIRLRTS